MGMRFREHLFLSSFALCLSLLAGCGAGTNNGPVERGLAANGNQANSGQKMNGREVSLGERFKLSRDEKVSVKDTLLTVQLKSVRRTWRVDGKSETADADLLITLDGKEQRQWVDIGEKVAVGDYVVELWGANPFGKTDCQIVVTRR